MQTPFAYIEPKDSTQYYGRRADGRYDKVAEFISINKYEAPHTKLPMATSEEASNMFKFGVTKIWIMVKTSVIMTFFFE